MKLCFRETRPIPAVAIWLPMPLTAAASEELVIPSKVLSEPRVADVQLPANYATSSDTFPVLYVLDGDRLFPPVAAIARWLEYVTRTPGMIVVGIRNTRRTSDFATRWTGLAGVSVTLASAAV